MDFVFGPTHKIILVIGPVIRNKETLVSVKKVSKCNFAGEDCGCIGAEVCTVSPFEKVCRGSGGKPQDEIFGVRNRDGFHGCQEMEPPILNRSECPDIGKGIGERSNRRRNNARFSARNPLLQNSVGGETRFDACVKFPGI